MTALQRQRIEKREENKQETPVTTMNYSNQVQSSPDLRPDTALRINSS